MKIFQFGSCPMVVFIFEVRALGDTITSVSGRDGSSAKQSVF